MQKQFIITESDIENAARNLSLDDARLTLAASESPDVAALLGVSEPSTFDVAAAQARCSMRAHDFYA